MKNLNIFNLQEIIFSNQKILEFLRLNQKQIYEEWQSCLQINNKSAKTLFFIKFLNFLNTKEIEIKKFIENILGFEIKIEIFDVGLVKHYNVNIDDIDFFLNKEDMNKYLDIVLYRSKNDVKITTWR